MGLFKCTRKLIFLCTMTVAIRRSLWCCRGLWLVPHSRPLLSTSRQVESPTCFFFFSFGRRLNSQQNVHLAFINVANLTRLGTRGIKEPRSDSVCVILQPSAHSAAPLTGSRSEGFQGFETLDLRLANHLALASDLKCQDLLLQWQITHWRCYLLHWPLLDSSQRATWPSNMA